MLIWFCHRLARRLAAALVRCVLTAGAFAQNTTPARPSGSVSIH